jgi:hypothetical protein
MVGKPSEDSPPTGLSSGDDVVFSSCCSDGGVGVMVTLGDGSGDGQNSDPVIGDPRSISLAPDLGARVPVGLPLRLTQILTVYLGAVLGGESSIGMTSMGSSSSSSSTMATHSPSSLRLGDEGIVHLGATGYGQGMAQGGSW